MKPYFLVITGPTGVGKSDIALKIAEQIPAEIINGDMGQCYQPFTIGTAKPDWQHNPIPHHLFDIFSEPTQFSVMQYRERILKLLPEIWGRSKLPIIVGGSGFYINSLFFPVAEVQGKKVVDIQTSEHLWEQLYAIDPERAARIHKNDTYRIKRALALWQHTGQKPSTLLQPFSPPSSFSCIFISRDKEELYARINDRVVQMITNGWIDEVKRIKNTEWEQFLKTKKLIGYERILNFLDDNINSEQQLIEQIQRKTRNYAKRQMTFFRMLEKKLKTADASLNMQDQILTINVSNEPAQEVINRIIVR